jgi:serine/threonine protein kinase
MAEVYLAVAEGPSGFSKLLVLKLMRSDLSSEERPHYLQMFQDEARIAARLNHPNIVQSHEVGMEEDQPFIVMEYLDGQPLSRIQQRDRKSQVKALSLERCLYVLCEVLEGLEYAHTLADYDGTPLHVVHRDVSPENIFVTYSGRVKLVDFGIAKSLASNQTRAGVVKGKASYMAPEQLRGTGVDGRADLFSVGVLLWEVIAGRPMHPDLSVYDIFARVVRGGLPSIREVVPDVAPALARIVDRALAIDRAERYPDAASFRQDLLTVLDGFPKVRAPELGERIALTFAAERAEISAIIRDGLSGAPLDTRSASGPVTRVVTPGPTSTPPPALSTPEEEAPTMPSPHSTPRLAAPTPVPPRRSATRAKWLVAVAVVAAAAALAGLTSGSWSSAPELSSVASVSVAIRATPAEARILLDGERLANPYHAQHLSDASEHELVVEASGFATRRRTLRLDRAVDLSIQLAPAPIHESAAGEPSTTAPTALPVGDEPTRAVRERPRSKPERRNPDMYRDLPPPRPTKARAPALDKEDPWAP